MGLLSEGSPLSWEETKALAEHVRKHGIIQFINLYKRLRDRKKDMLYWGDEVEYMLVKFDHKQKTAKLALRAHEILDDLQEKERNNVENNPSLWRPEYADYMVEGTPGKPYGGSVAHFNLVEANMKFRREELQKLLAPDEVPFSLTVFPRLGCEEFTVPKISPTPRTGDSHSLFFPDDVIYSEHPRFRTLTRNIRERRGEKVAINIPIFKDTKTKSPFVEDFARLGDNGESQVGAKPDHIYMDCMGCGMGNSCLQVTFQACNVDEARFLYDQLTTVCPIMLAVSAASPLYRGYISDNDTRWTVISQSVDCRTREERGLEPLKNDKFRIKKSRYDSIDSYLSPQGERYNDIELVYDKEICQELLDAGIDGLLARHIAHLFIRDTISLFSEKIHQNDEEETDHFENIQSTNWQTMRFKPPPPKSNIGWRVEFRPMEVQLSDFENAAYVVFIVLLTRAILSYKLNLLIPISKVDENLEVAYKKNSLLEGKFYFRKDVTTESSPPEACECLSVCSKSNCQSKEEEYTLMTANEIINGSAEFPGLVPLVLMYLDSIEVDIDTRCTMQQYIKLIGSRASGELKTTATWIRDFVTSHPEYKQDSVVSEQIAYDLLVKCEKVTNGELVCPELFTPLSKTVNNIPSALSKTDTYLNAKNPPK